MADNTHENWDEFLNNSTVGVHLVNGEGKIIWANDTELNLLGYHRDEYTGQHIRTFHADQDVINTILNLLSSGEALSTYPAQLKAKDGSIKYVLINSNVYYKDNTFIHTRCFTSEISQSIYTHLRTEFIHATAT